MDGSKDESGIRSRCLVFETECIFFYKSHQYKQANNEFKVDFVRQEQYHGIALYRPSIFAPGFRNRQHHNRKTANCIDLFNPINPADYSKIEKDGADAVSFTYSFGNFTDLNVVYNPQDKPENSNAGFRFRTNFDEYDLAAVGGYFDNRFVLGGDFASNFFDAGIRGEGIISMDKYDLGNNYVRLIFGMDNQFTSKLYAMFEYQYNGQGAPNKDSYDLLALLDGRVINLSRNYLFLSASYQITPLLTLTGAENMNLNDGSGFSSLSGAYSLSDNSTLTFGALISYGSKFSEYWYYPTSVYLQGQLFF